ncbi:MAG TPA: AMIN domain-containing protein [Candidatus Sulfotelmatobacter sp.]
MSKVRRIGLSTLLLMCLCLAVNVAAQDAKPVAATSPAKVVRTSTQPVPTAVTGASMPSAIKRVQVLSGKDAVEIEIEANSRLTPQTQVLTGPARLVVDFPNASPSAQLRNQSVNRGEVKDVRVGLFQSNPPVTRVVLDLKSAQSYQIFPGGKSVIIKVSGKSQAQARTQNGNSNNNELQGVEDFPAAPVTRPGLLTTNYTSGAGSIQAAMAQPALDVTFRNGMLSIKSARSSLAEILYAVQQRTGAEVTLSAGAEQEKVAADIAPGPAPEVLARLLNGSKFNFLIVSSPTDSRVLDRVILSPKAEGAVTPLPPMASNDMEDDDAPPPPPLRPQPLGENPNGQPFSGPTNVPNTNLPNTNLPPGHVQPPVGMPPSTPPPDDSAPE